MFSFVRSSLRYNSILCKHGRQDNFFHILSPLSTSVTPVTRDHFYTINAVHHSLTIRYRKMAIAIDQIALICNCDLSVCAVTLKGQLASPPQIWIKCHLQCTDMKALEVEGAVLCSRVSRECRRAQCGEGGINYSAAKYRSA